MSRLLLAAALLFTGALAASADDLDRILERDKVAAGKLLSDASAAIAESARLEKTSPGTAVLLLEKRIAEITDADSLSKEVRADMLSKLRARLSSVRGTLSAMEVAVREKAAREAEADLRKFREAEKRGSGVADTAKKYTGSVADQVAAADRIRRDKAAGFLGVMSSIDAAPVAIAGVVEFPKHWAKITDSPYRGSGPKLSPKEVALLKTLNSTMSADFNKIGFRDLIDIIQKKTGLTIFLDKASLDEASIDYDTPVTFEYPKVTVRTVLKKVLADLNLTYIIKEGAIQVMTPQKGRESMVIRTYPISNLVGLTDSRFSPFANKLMMYKNVDNLIRTLQSAVDPALWDINGGPGSITFFEPTLSIIVRAELHYMMGSGGLFR